MSTTTDPKSGNAWRWTPESKTNRLVDQDGNSIVAVTMPSSGTPRISVKRGNAALIAQAPGLLSHAEKSLGWLINQRDRFHEGCITKDGDVPDEYDREWLATYDSDIAELTALIALAKGINP